MTLSQFILMIGLIQIIPIILFIVAGIFLILTDKLKILEINRSKLFVKAGILILLGQILMLIFTIFGIFYSISLISAETVILYFVILLINSFLLLLAFSVCIMPIGIDNRLKFGNYLLFVAISGTITFLIYLIANFLLGLWLLGIIHGLGLITIVLLITIVDILSLATYLLIIFAGKKIESKQLMATSVFFLLGLIFQFIGIFLISPLFY